MKLTSLFCTTVLTLSLGGAGIALAQEPPQPPPAGAPSHEGRPKMRMDFLTPEEQTKLENARKQVEVVDPSIKADLEALKKEREAAKQSGVKPTPEERRAMMEKMKAIHDKTDAAMLKADPTIAPILEKIKAHRQEMMGKFGEKRGAKRGGAGGQNEPGTALAPATSK